jgi:Tfp pilus assembly protein PilO
MSVKHPGTVKVCAWRIYVGGVAVCAAMSAGVYFFGFRPAARKHRQFEARQHDANERRQQAANLAGQLNTARAQLAAVNEALVRQTLRLEPSNTLNHRLSRLNELAEASGLTIDEMNSADVEEGTDYQTIPIHIAGNGTYPACAKFLHELRQTFPDMAVRSFETNSNMPSPDVPAATFRYHLAWHAARD